MSDVGVVADVKQSVISRSLILSLSKDEAGVRNAHPPGLPPIPAQAGVHG
jgi:hypothetical protein